MPIDFDTVIDRRGTQSIKWQLYGAEVLPLWVADMDFAAPEAIRQALRRTVEHGIFGYEFPMKEMGETVAARMGSLYHWQVAPEAVVATPGVIAGFTAAAQASCAAGEGVLVQPPVYPPFLSVHEKAGLVRKTAPLTAVVEGQRLHYEMDRDVFSDGFKPEPARTAMFLLCNPHNPTGQVFSRSDLESMAETCLKNGATICSDEIHSELLPGGTKHIPIAALSAETGEHSITLIAPSKTFNVPGLFCGFAIIPAKELRERYKKAMERMAMHVNSMGLIAGQVAYSGACDEWLAELLVYLKGNRDVLIETIQRDMAEVKLTCPEATYLEWLDFRALNLQPSPAKFFLEKARVALNDGAEFGQGGEGFVRLNFGCPRATLMEALKRMKTAIELAE